MAKKGFFQRLADFGRQLFGGQKSNSRLDNKNGRAVKSEADSIFEPIPKQQPISKSPPVPEPESIFEPEPIFEAEPTSTAGYEGSSRLSDYGEHVANDYAKEQNDAIREAEYAERLNFESKRKELEPIIDEANRRIGNIVNLGLQSAALSRVEEETGRPYLTLDEAETIPQLITEATRARVFLNDRTSTIEGAKVYTAQLNAEEFRGKFGNQYHTWEHKYKNFDTKAINEEVAKKVFENYRKLEELRAADIVGEGAYGSENLIIAMYDAEIRGEDSFMAGLDQLESHYKQKTAEWQERFERSNSVAAILGLYSYNDEEGYYF